MFLLNEVLRRERHDNRAVLQKLQLTSRILQELLPNQQIGLEFEAEFPSNVDSKMSQVNNAVWVSVLDHSLRNGMEYRSNGPRLCSDIERDVRFIVDYLTKNNAQRSIRTSIHQHLDFSDYQSDELRAFLVLCVLLEPTMFAYVGQERERLLFCQRLVETNVPTMCVGFLNSGKTKDIPGETMRYSGVNLAALTAHGTIEFRHTPLSFDVPYIITWIELLILMKSFCYASAGNTAEKILTLSAAGVLIHELTKDYPDFAERMRFIAPSERENHVATALCFGELKYPSIEIDDNFRVKLPENW